MAKVAALDLWIAARKKGLNASMQLAEDVQKYVDTPVLCRSRADSHRKRGEAERAEFFDFAANYLQRCA